MEITDNNDFAISWYAHSISGTRKPVNDDSWLACAASATESKSLPSSGSHSLSQHDLIFAISDGMGGKCSGDIASRLLLDYLSETIPATLKIAAQGMHPDYLEYLDEAIQRVSNEINQCAVGQHDKKGMGATLVMAWFTPENMYICNVGDSRLYLFRQNDESETSRNIEQLSQDHTFAWRSMNRGDINEREYRAHPRRAALYEVIGGGHKSVKPYVAAISYQQGDKLLLCSDGVIDGLWDKHIHSALQDDESTLKNIGETLIQRAVDNDGTDDTTLIVLKIA